MRLTELKLLREFIREALHEASTPEIFYRVQPKGKSLFGHTSGLAYEKVPGVFAFTDPEQLFDTYTWIHVRKSLSNYEMVKFRGRVIDRPDDSEGVVVEPESELERLPLEQWLATLN